MYFMKFCRKKMPKKQKFVKNMKISFSFIWQVSGEQPSDVNFTAVNEIGNVMNLNGAPVLEVTPTEDKYLIKVIVSKFISFLIWIVICILYPAESYLNLVMK